MLHVRIQVLVLTVNFMSHLKQIAIYTLVTSVAILTLIAVLSIWDVLSEEVLGKSLSTIGVVAFGALIVVVASQALDNKNNTNKPL